MPALRFNFGNLLKKKKGHSVSGDPVTANPINEGVRKLFFSMRKPNIPENPSLRVVSPMKDIPPGPIKPIKFKGKSSSPKIEHLETKETYAPPISTIRKAENQIATKVKGLSQDISNLRKIREDFFGKKRMAEVGPEKHKQILEGTVNTPEAMEFNEMEEIMKFFRILDLERSMISFLMEH